LKWAVEECTDRNPKKSEQRDPTKLGGTDGKTDRAPRDRAKSNPTKMGGCHTKIGGTVIPQTRESPKWS
jgi:hypothetical protein